MSFVKIRCNVITSSQDAADATIAWLSSPAVPARGELLNVSGNPYIVANRSWAWDGDENQMYAYLRLSPYQAGMPVI